jgi:hypothetical protein
MTGSASRPLRFALAIAAGIFSLFAVDRPSPRNVLLNQAQAEIGRPMTPMSYAGVARRTTRRAAAVGTAATVGTAAAVSASRCSQVVNAYGQIITRCN